MEKVTAIVPAAGSSKRMGGTMNKQFLLLAGEPVLIRTLKTLAEVELISEIILVLQSKDRPYFDRLYLSHPIQKITRIVDGGEERQFSVFNGLQALADDVRWVVIHDAARPLVTPDLLVRTIIAAYDSGAAVVGLPLKDTVKFVEDEWVLSTPERSRLWAVQTPQVFRRDLIVGAYEKALRDGVTVTDDASVVERYHYKVRVIAGEEENIKITTPLDLLVAEAILSSRKW